MSLPYTYSRPRARSRLARAGCLQMGVLTAASRGIVRRLSRVAKVLRHVTAGVAQHVLGELCFAYVPFRRRPQAWPQPCRRRLVAGTALGLPGMRLFQQALSAALPQLPVHTRTDPYVVCRGVDI